MGNVLRPVVVLAVLFGTGAPIAYVLARGRSEWVRFSFESLAIGLLVQVVIGVLAYRSGRYSLPLLAAMTLVPVVAGVVVARRGAIRGRPALDVPLLLLTVGLVVAALLLRRYPSYFAFKVGDMGGYVNGANRIAAGLGAGQLLPGFMVLLAGTNALLGPARTVSVLPALGVMVLLGTISFGKLIRLRTAAVVVVGLIVAVHPITIWFSLFPVSESLYSVLLICVLYFLVRARRDCSLEYAAATGLFAGCMLLVRVNAMLLAPILVVVLLASAAIDDDERYRIQRAVTIVALAALAVAYTYDIHYVRPYMVRQLQGKAIPNFAFQTAQRWRLFNVSAALVVVVAAAFALVFGAARLVRTYLAPMVRLSPYAFWRRAAAGVAGCVVVGLLVVQRDGLEDGLERWGPALLALAAAGIALIALRPGRYLDGTEGFFALLAVAAYALLFALRLPEARPAIYYLYWDRYLYSEVLPIALVLIAIGLHALIGMCTDSRPERLPLRVSAAVGLIVVIGLGTIVPWGQTRRSGITRRPLYGDSYAKLSRLDQLTQSDGDAPIVYSGARPVPAGWFFPNTSNAFARPLAESFDRVIVGTAAFNGIADPVYDPRDAQLALARAGFDGGYLIALRSPSAARFPDDVDTQYLGSLDYDVPILRRSLHPWSERFSTVALHFDVYALGSRVRFTS